MQCIKCKVEFVSEEVIEDDEDFCPACKVKAKEIAIKVDTIIKAKREARADKPKIPGFDYQKARLNQGKSKINYMNV